MANRVGYENLPQMEEFSHSRTATDVIAGFTFSGHSENKRVAIILVVSTVDDRQNYMFNESMRK